MAALISVNKLTKTYGKGQMAFTALKDVTLKIDAGEVVAITGKSGSGKSTLMHLLALLDTPSGGSITIDGISAGKLKRTAVDSIRNRQFGFVFQQFFLNGHETVLNNVILPL